MRASCDRSARIQHVQIFKPKVDERYSADHLVSHSDMRIQSEVVSSAAAILEKLDCHAEVIGIDEGEFFDVRLVEICITSPTWKASDCIVAGLDTDYPDRPFEPMPQLMAIAEYVEKTLASSRRCFEPTLSKNE